MLTVEVLDSLDQLRSLETEWNRLWDASDCHFPFNRCEPLALALQTWFADRPLRIVVVREGAQLRAALPLVLSRRTGGLTVAELPNLCWNFGDPLLLDREGDRATVLRKLLRALMRLPVFYLHLDWIPLDASQWQLAMEQLRGAGHVVQCKRRFEVGVIDVPESAAALTERWSKNTRKQLRRSERALAAEGHCRRVDYDPERLSEQLEAALQLEHAGWKGRGGSSILSDPVASRFFHQWATSLHREGRLNLEFLMLDDRPIAFDLGTQSGDVITSCKVSYSEAFKKWGPGQLLLAWQLRDCVMRKRCRWIDTIGPITEATRRWTTRTYPVGSLTVSNGAWLSNVGVAAYGTLVNSARQFRGNR